MHASSCGFTQEIHSGLLLLFLGGAGWLELSLPPSHAVNNQYLRRQPCIFPKSSHRHISMPEAGGFVVGAAELIPSVLGAG